MGKAYKPPQARYTRTRYVSKHAIERFRERLSKNTAAIFRDDDDLGNLLDRSLQSSIDAGRTEQVTDRKSGTLVTIVPFDAEELTRVKDEVLYGIIQPDERRPGGEAVVTVLDAEMVATSRARHWITPEATSRPFAGALDKLKADKFKAAPPKPSTTPGVAPDRADNTGGGRSVLAFETTVVRVEYRRAGWASADWQHEMWAPGPDLDARLQALCADEALEVRAWGEIPLRVERVVRVKLGS